MQNVIYEKVRQPADKGPSIKIRLTKEKNGYLLLIVYLDERTNNEIHGCKKEVCGWWDLGPPHREKAIDHAVELAQEIDRGEVEE